MSGTPVAVEAWDGGGVTSTPTSTPTEDSVAFDPCALPSEVLQELDMAGTTPIPLAGTNGCVWADSTFAVGVQIVPNTIAVDPSHNPMLSQIEELNYDDYTTYMFVMDGDTYATHTTTELGVVAMNVTVLGSMEAAKQSMLDTFATIAPFFPPPA